MVFQGIAAILQSCIFCLNVVYKHRDSNIQTITLSAVLYGFATWSLTLTLAEGV